MKNMRLLSLLVLFFLPAIKLFSQASLVIYTQETEPFTVIMNGIQQNPDPETNVRITGLDAPSYKVKIVYTDAGIPEVSKTVFPQTGQETTFELIRNNKGVRTMRMRTVHPVPIEVEPVRGQEVYVFSPTPRTSTTSVSQTTTVTAAGAGIPGMAGGISVTTTTTQSTTSVTTGGNVVYDDREGHGHHGGGEGYEEHGDRDYADYDGPRGCPHPISGRDFEQAKESITSKTFSDSKMTLAKQITSSNCLLSRHVREIMKLFDYESDRLEFAKFAFKYTWDQKRYYLVNDAFEYESSIDDLNKYIQSFR